MARRDEILNAVYEADRLHKEHDTESRAKHGEGRIDVFGMLVGRDIPVMFRPLKNLLGAYIDDPGQGVMVTTQRQLPVQRFTAAHELGHAALGHEASLDEEDILMRALFDPSARFDSREIQANAFATELLTPQWLIVEHMKRQGWSRNELSNPVVVYQLSLRMGSSYTATCYALMECKGIDRPTCEKLLKAKKKSIKQSLAKPYEPKNWYGDGSGNGYRSERKAKRRALRPALAVVARFKTTWSARDFEYSGYLTKTRVRYVKAGLEGNPLRLGLSPARIVGRPVGIDPEGVCSLMNDPGNAPAADSPPTRDDTPLLAVPLSPDYPQQIGRYRIEKVLGEGGFGRVYLAHDDQLHRHVAIKVPRRQRLSEKEAEAYLAEARVLASLDHPNIVPVFDVGTTDGLWFVVSKLIEGCDLATKIKEDRPSNIQAAELMATVAEALHYSHRKGLVHRDIKPANILIDTTGMPYVADFGLALKEEDFGKGAKFAGTPAYMSPEQTRGEGHRVDGRSDLFSLGVVFYELLIGRRPFLGQTQSDLLEQITAVEVRPLRQVDDRVPKELERICLKTLSKRASERYTTGKDMADDLRHFLAQATVGQPLAVQVGVPASQPPTSTPGTNPTALPLATPTPVAPVRPASDSQPIKIVPKGLRSFDAHDADFFLELLPGPRDREGLPDSIRFWKTRIEEVDSDTTFSVGLIYGPSGCGKSSLVKAGLLPRLADSVVSVYIEATASETESRLLNGMRKRCPALSDNRGLKETLAALRRGQGIPAGKKVLIVLDQFEQWLHAKKEEQNTELVQALRQCDGGRVQCIVMVRDDFWLAVSRFLRDLEIRLVEGQNSALADLFDGDHARKVLAAFGRAFGKLPGNSGDTSKDQQQFLVQAVSGLAQEGKVISVRLALFAEMMKGKTWTPATLKEVGGTAGLGVTFLEETFSATTAPPEHRYHQQAARGVLKALLPESGTDIKGHMRFHADLLEASGYGSRPKDFDDLLCILDSEIRLITPTDPEGKDAGESGGVSPRSSDTRYYQLTHDYLVPSLRDWLTRKQKETRRGRAELLLADRAGVWNVRPENRQLPSLLQWFNFRWWTQKKNWTPPQRKMMRKATRYHAVRGAGLALLLAVATFTGLAIREQGTERQQATHAAGLVQRVLDAETAQVPGVVGEMADYRSWVDPLLRQEIEKAAANSRQQLHASLALLPVDSTQVDYLHGRLLAAAPHEVPVIRDALASHKDALGLDLVLPGELLARLFAEEVVHFDLPLESRPGGEVREVDVGHRGLDHVILTLAGVAVGPGPPPPPAPCVRRATGRRSRTSVSGRGRRPSRRSCRRTPPCPAFAASRRRPPRRSPAGTRPG